MTWRATFLSFSVFMALGCTQAPATTETCLGGSVNCAGVCVELQSDNRNCGACATVCDATHTCISGNCSPLSAPACPAGQVSCAGACVDPQTDETHCGASGACGGAQAGAACAAGQVCSGGTCALTCQAGLVDCGGKCIDPLSDAAHCGASGACSGGEAGTVCAAGQVCSAGACGLTCQAGLVACDGKCIDPVTDRAFCGASAGCSGAGTGAICAAGQVCSGGSCALSCQAGLLACGSKCIDPRTDRAYCGATGSCTGGQAGTVCAAGQVCAAGGCATSCPTDQVACAGKCVDPLTDRAFCGASGLCTGGNAGTVCTSGMVCAGGACQTSCPTGELACGGRCADPVDDPRYCGASLDCTGGAACGPSAFCYQRACYGLCPAGQVFCSGSCVDPQTSQLHCGASGYCTGVSAGVACGGGQTCQAGGCALPPCSWVSVWQASLSSLPAGATARGGTIGQAVQFGSVGGRTAFTSSSDWSEILALASLAAGDDSFAVQADFFADAVALTAGNPFRNLGLYLFTDVSGPGQAHGVWVGFREQSGQATQLQWVVSPTPLPGTGWDAWDLNLNLGVVAQAEPLALPLGAWHTLRVEGIRSQCRLRALLDGAVVSTWTPATCDLGGALVGVAAARVVPLNVAWTNLAVEKGSPSLCAP